CGWIELRGTAQQAFAFRGITAEESRQLGQHLPLCGEHRRVVRREDERLLELAPGAPDVAQEAEEAVGLPSEVGALAEVAEDGEVRGRIQRVRFDGFLGTLEPARQDGRAIRWRRRIGGI